MNVPSKPASRRRQKQRRLSTASLALLALGMTGAAHAQSTGFSKTAAGPWDYNDIANWVGGNINGIWDTTLVLGAGQTATFGADTVLTTGLNFNYDGANNLTLRGTGANRTLTLGGDINVGTVNTSRTISIGSATASQNLNVDLGGIGRALNVGSGRTLTFANVVSNGSLTTTGGTVTFNAANTYSGDTNIKTGTLTFTGATASSVNSDIYVNANSSNTSTLTFNSNASGNTGATRAKSVTLRGAGNSSGVLLTVNGNATANSVDFIANALTVASGNSIITVTANAARNAQLGAASFIRNTGTTVLFRGSNLGLNSSASLTAGAANITFGSVALTGGAGTTGQTTISIIKGAYGDSTAGGSGSGLVTHDATNGVRLLDTTTEYTAAITDGQTQLNNVRYVRATGDAAVDTNLTAPLTTINSLSFRVSGAGTNSGMTISGDAGTTLKLNSGAIFAQQTVTATATSDAMVVNVPNLDLNGQEGVFVAFTAGVSNGNTAAPLQINSSIGNDGGKGVTIGGTGQVIFGGATAHTYTGVTTLNSGILRLSKSVTNASIPGDLVMNGGTLLKNSNVIPDTATVTLNAGSFTLDNTTSSGNNNHVETLGSLIMNGGSIVNHGSNAALTMNGDLTMNASQISMNQGGDVIVLGTTTMNGGVLFGRESSSTTASNGLLRFNTLIINNTASSAYTPIVLNGHSTNKGALMTLNGDLTFNGNATNTNTTIIDSSDTALVNQGVIALNGYRSLDIGNGAAGTDLTIVPAFTDSGVVQGGLRKIGAGTLAITGASTYTGGTNIDAGKLILGGSLTGTVSVVVLEGATLATDDSASIVTAGGITLDGILAPGDQGTVGTLTTTLGIGGKLGFSSTSSLRFDLSSTATASDLVSFTSVGDWLDGSGLGTLSLSGTINYTETYTIFDNVSTTGFTFAAINGYDTLNYAANFAKSGDDYQLSFTAIPEPGSALLMLGGLGMMACTRRFRGRNASHSR